MSSARAPAPRGREDDVGREEDRVDRVNVTVRGVHIKGLNHIGVAVDPDPRAENLHVEALAVQSLQGTRRTRW